MTNKQDESFMPPARRVRADRIASAASNGAAVAEVEPQITPAALSRNAYVVAEMVEQLQINEQRVRAENSDLKARLEQYQDMVSALTAQLKETSELADKWKERHTYVRAILINVGGLVADGTADERN